MITLPEEMPFSNLSLAPTKKLTNTKESFTVSLFVSDESNYISKGGKLWKAHTK
jgi:hypothetical protein